MNNKQTQQVHAQNCYCVEYTGLSVNTSNKFAFMYQPKKRKKNAHARPNTVIINNVISKYSF